MDAKRYCKGMRVIAKLAETVKPEVTQLREAAEESVQQMVNSGEPLNDEDLAAVAVTAMIGVVVEGQLAAQDAIKDRGLTKASLEMVKALICEVQRLRAECRTLQTKLQTVETELTPLTSPAAEAQA